MRISKRVPKAVIFLGVMFVLGQLLMLAGSLIPLVNSRMGNTIYVPGQLVFTIGLIGLIAAFLGRAASGASYGYSWAVVFAIGMAVLSFLVPAFLVFLATNGNASAFFTTYEWFADGGGTVTNTEGVLPVIVTLLLIGIPAALHSKKGWRSSSSPKKDIVLGWLAVAASLVTGLFGIVTHFIRSGPMPGIPFGQLSVAVIFAVLVLVPIYRRLARAFSERGIMIVCDPATLWNDQKEALDVLRGALSERKETDVPSQKAEKH